ncbi:hypothetical protein N481_14740 [Pseudoalteromonas luteoviolacea S4047-1]|uniref:Uncharacterized protein n=1 Tax=Pseudoalteromonas luteoviolacea S4054 TaxID=1129367 RepID=A0A0F6AGG0_9GAMM|nr:hypothetical protein N479_07150 [Pseudoalteromonas luteoviolacea S4054]KZN72483.1 hypothetical protein N481_14740 [Pseudoalteromonas luteoviolacea S4047-1]
MTPLHPVSLDKVVGGSIWKPTYPEKQKLLKYTTITVDKNRH